MRFVVFKEDRDEHDGPSELRAPCWQIGFSDLLLKDLILKQKTW